MQKINSIQTVGFVGETDLLLRALTCPFEQVGDVSCFYYKSSLYRIEKPEDASVRIVIFSAVDLFCNLQELLSLVHEPKTVVYITNCRRAKRLGFCVDKRGLSYMLGCPVVFDDQRTAGGLNMLLDYLHMVSMTPCCCTAMNNPSVARKSILTIKPRLHKRITYFFAKLFKIDK